MIAILARDLQLATRSGSGAGLALAFFLVLVLISALGLGPNPDRLAAAAPGILWIGALLAALLSLDRLFQADYEDGTLDILATAPLPLEAIAAAKIAGHWLTTAVPLVILSPVLALTLNLPSQAYLTLIASLAIGTIALSAIGAIGAALTLGIRRGGLLLSLLTVPLYIPALIFGVTAVQNAAEGLATGTPLLLLSGLTFFTLALGPIAAAAALRVNMS